MISLTSHDFQWGRSEVVIIYPDEAFPLSQIPYLSPMKSTISHCSTPSSMPRNAPQFTSPRSLGTEMKRFTSKALSFSMYLQSSTNKTGGFHQHKQQKGWQEAKQKKWNLHKLIKYYDYPQKLEIHQQKLGISPTKIGIWPRDIVIFPGLMAIWPWQRGILGHQDWGLDPWRMDFTWFLHIKSRASWRHWRRWTNIRHSKDGGPRKLETCWSGWFNHCWKNGWC